jgi:hypothetical protein
MKKSNVIKNLALMSFSIAALANTALEASAASTTTTGTLHYVGGTLDSAYVPTSLNQTGTSSSSSDSNSSDTQAALDKAVDNGKTAAQDAYKNFQAIQEQGFTEGSPEYDNAYAAAIQAKKDYGAAYDKANGKYGKTAADNPVVTLDAIKNKGFTEGSPEYDNAYAAAIQAKKDHGAAYVRKQTENDVQF